MNRRGGEAKNKTQTAGGGKGVVGSFVSATIVMLAEVQKIN